MRLGSEQNRRMTVRFSLALCLVAMLLVIPVLHVHWGAGGELHCSFCINHASIAVEAVEVVTTFEQHEAEPSRPPLYDGRTADSPSQSRAPPA
jgi:hypothetical protein